MIDHRAVTEILTHWGLPTSGSAILLDHPDGRALLALLCNAGAKDWPDRPGNPVLYAHKARLVASACEAAGPGRWWRDIHQEMPIFLIETGLALDDQSIQMAFHFRPGDTLPDLAQSPEPAGRHWRRVELLPRARQLARDYLAARGLLVA